MIEISHFYEVDIWGVSIYHLDLWEGIQDIEIFYLSKK